MDGITVYDYLLLPIYLWLIYKIAYYYKNKLYPIGHELEPYFIPALTCKILGALFIGLFYKYYYGNGDTFNYFYHIQIINSTFFHDPGSWLRLITHTADDSKLTDAQALSDMFWYDYIAAYVTSCLGAVIGILCFTLYLPINVIIAAITFIALWLMFTVYARYYKHIIKYVALAILFMPGVIVWGSGLFKDSFCIFALGCLVYVSDLFFSKRVFKLSLLILALFSIAILVLIKAYILVVLLPALIIKEFLYYKKRLILHPEKRLKFYFILGAFCITSMLLIGRIGTYLADFTVQNLLETVVTQKNNMLMAATDEGSSYNLGDFEPSLSSMVSKMGPAINVFLFRPYVWEAGSIMQLLNAFESMVVTLLFLYLIFRKNIFGTIKTIYNDPNLIMFLFFTVVFGFFVGITSYNFGALSRFKIPGTPFYMLFLVILIFNKDKIVEVRQAEDSLQSN